MIHLNNIKHLSWQQILFAMALIIATVVPVSAQEKPGDSALTVRKVFETLQSPALELLKPSTRLDMLDYWDVDSVYKAKNALNGMSYLDTVTPGYMKVMLTPVSSLQIKLLPDKKGVIVMTIYTVGGERQAKDSQIEFYDSELRKLDTSRYFKEPDLKEFFEIPKGSATSMKEIREMIPFTTFEYEASPDNNDLKSRLTVTEYMNVDDRNIVQLFLRPEVVMQWKGKYKAK